MSLFAPPVLADRKGYAWGWWFTAGPPGLVALAFQPDLRWCPAADRDRFQRRAAWIGGGLSVAVLAGFGLSVWLTTGGHPGR